MASVLGKRTRSSGSAQLSPTCGRSAKRIQILEDEDDRQTQHHKRSEVAAASRRSKPGHSVGTVSELPCKQFTSVNTAHTNEHTLRAIDDIRDDLENRGLQSRKKSKVSSYGDLNASKIAVTSAYRVGCVKPRIPQTILASASANNKNRDVYDEARKLFSNTSIPTQMIGREHEKSELQEFISTRVQARSGGCVYLSGPPGTGKSALVNLVCSEFAKGDEVKVAFVNCMSIKAANDIIPTVASELAISEQILHSAFQSTPCRAIDASVCLLVLDEIDSLLSIDSNTLYNFFKSALNPRSQLILVGIANALDLTDRFLPKLKTQNLKPKLLPFLPYNAGQIAAIISERCRLLLPPDTTAATNFTPVLQPAAIQLISKKVASQNGDLRKAFDLVIKTTSLIQAETVVKSMDRTRLSHVSSHEKSSRPPLGQNNNLSHLYKHSESSPMKNRTSGEPGSTVCDTFTPENAPRAVLSHVVKATSSSSHINISQRLKVLNFQQKIVLCLLVALQNKYHDTRILSPPPSPEKETMAKPLRSHSSTAPTVQSLTQTYSILCSQDNHLQVLSPRELRDVVATLESLSLISFGEDSATSKRAASLTGKNAHMKSCITSRTDNCRVSTCFSISEIETAIDGIGRPVLEGILRNGRLL